MLELKNVKHAAFASHETHCFEATVYVDGERFAYVSNEGTGGADHLRSTLAGETWASFNRRCLEVAKRINPNAVETYDEVDRDEKHPWPYPDDWYTKHSMTAQQVLEAVICEKVNEWLAKKEMRRVLNREFVFVSGDQLVVWKKKQRAFADRSVDECIQKIRSANPDLGSCLNIMAQDEALKVFVSHG